MIPGTGRIPNFCIAFLDFFSLLFCFPIFASSAAAAGAPVAAAGVSCCSSSSGISSSLSDSSSAACSFFSTEAASTAAASGIPEISNLARPVTWTCFFLPFPFNSTHSSKFLSRLTSTAPNDSASLNISPSKPSTFSTSPFFTFSKTNSSSNVASKQSCFWELLCSVSPTFKEKKGVCLAKSVHFFQIFNLAQNNFNPGHFSLPLS
mmetsp:Transcript_12059/g.15635  ORF Transcript_12059/g.15635 Transcript_12059/m.15635 type:complete len:206 (+) Transcript_12059:564-1181(+)